MKWPASDTREALADTSLAPEVLRLLGFYVQQSLEVRTAIAGIR